MKHLKLAAIALCVLVSCTKEQTTPSVNAEANDDLKVKPKVSIYQSCFDGDEYNFSYNIKRLKPNSSVYAGAYIGTSILSKKQVMAKDGDGAVFVLTGESGPAANLYIEVINGKDDFFYTKDGSRLNCN